MLQGDDEQLPLAQQTDQPLTAKHLALADRPQVGEGPPSGHDPAVVAAR